MSFLHHIDFIFHWFNWHTNPVCRFIEAGYWKALDAEFANERAGRML